MDELVDYITKEHAQYDMDSASSKFTIAIKSALGPLRFLLNAGGRAAGDVCCAQDAEPSTLPVADLFSGVPWRLANAIGPDPICRSKWFHALFTSMHILTVFQSGVAVEEYFKTVAKLFTRIEQFTTRLKTVNEVEIPTELLPIYKGMLLILLEIRALGIGITKRYFDQEEMVFSAASVGLPHKPC